MDANVVADKIKYYRKKLNLSQEDLGQKLFVSKQTISLWEKGQTVPTVDNLIRLKEIFGVSVDEIINPEVEEEKEIPQAKEEYFSWYYTDEELLEFKKHRNRPFIASIILLCFMPIILISFSWLVESLEGFWGGIFGGFFIIALSLACVLFLNRKVIKNNMKILKSREYKILVYDDYFFYETKQENEITNSGKVKFSDITSIEDTGKLLIVNFDVRCIPMRKESLKSDSVFYSLQEESAEKKRLKPPVKKWKVISDLLVAFSALSIFIAFFFYLICFDHDLKYLWFFSIFFVIPLSSLVYAFVLRKKGFKYKKNVIVFVIMLVIFMKTGQGFNEHFDEYIEDEYLYDYMETSMSVDFPEYSAIAHMKWDENLEVVRDKEFVYQTTDLFFNQEDVVGFEEYIKTDSRWLKKFPDNLKPYMTSIVSPDSYDYMFIYNDLDEEFNKKIEPLPEEEGEAHGQFIGGFYNSKTNQMKLVEYSVWVKEKN